MGAGYQGTCDIPWVLTSVSWIRILLLGVVGLSLEKSMGRYDLKPWQVLDWSNNQKTIPKSGTKDLGGLQQATTHKRAFSRIGMDLSRVLLWIDDITRKRPQNQTHFSKLISPCSGILCFTSISRIGCIDCLRYQRPSNIPNNECSKLGSK